ncbi:MAG: magnesium transporter [Firmicutes bacterium]|nr:magnesium transporter [Bacillota bacterium]
MTLESKILADSQELQEQIIELVENKNIKELKVLLVEMDDARILYAISEFSRKEKALIYRLLPKDKALAIFEQLDTTLQAELLESFTEKNAIEVIEELDPDDRVTLLDELPRTVAKRLISLLSPEDRAITNLLLGYEQGTAGRIMTTEFISLDKNMSAKEALEKVRKQAKYKETIYTLYVTDEKRRLEGVLSLKKLLTADEDASIGNIMYDAAIAASTYDPQEHVAEKLKDFDLLAIPVVDRENHIVGIVTVDDAIDILEQQATDEMLNQSGLAGANMETNRSEVLVNGSLWRIWRIRLPFLLITMAAGILSGFIIGGFEETLYAIPAVAMFIPIIMDMGGNVGTQSTTVFVRGIALGHIESRRFWKHLIKEICVGLSLSILVGTTVGIIAGAWQGIPLLGVAVGLSLIIAMTLASFLGFMVPFILIKLKMDSAAGSSPLITSIKDMVGLTVYFGLVSVLLSSLL